MKSGDWMLLYAAAGGVGLIAAQWARELGARVIGIVSTAAKRELALRHGCEHVLLDGDDIPRRVRELSGGGVPVVYDSVGRTTFYQSLDCLRPHGVLVSFGNSSGKVEPFGLHELTRRGSLYVTRPTLYDFIRDRASLEAGARRAVRARRARAHRDRRSTRPIALRDAAQAHRDLEARKTTGCTGPDSVARNSARFGRIRASRVGAARTTLRARTSQGGRPCSSNVMRSSSAAR